MNYMRRISPSLPMGYAMSSSATLLVGMLDSAVVLGIRAPTIFRASVVDGHSIATGVIVTIRWRRHKTTNIGCW